jgi:hypothetical protein
VCVCVCESKPQDDFLCVFVFLRDFILAWPPYFLQSSHNVQGMAKDTPMNKHQKTAGYLEKRYTHFYTLSFSRIDTYTHIHIHRHTHRHI